MPRIKRIHFFLPNNMPPIQQGRNPITVTFFSLQIGCYHSIQRKEPTPNPKVEMGSRTLSGWSWISTHCWVAISTHCPCNQPNRTNASWFQPCAAKSVPNFQNQPIFFFSLKWQSSQFVDEKRFLGGTFPFSGRRLSFSVEIAFWDLFFAANDGNGHFLQFLKITSTGMFFLETSQCFQLRNPRGVASLRRRLKKVDFVEIEMSFSVKIQFWAVSGQLLILGIDEKSAKLTIVQCLHIHRDRLSVPLWADRIWTCHESCFCQLARVTAISKGFDPS